MSAAHPLPAKSSSSQGRKRSARRAAVRVAAVVEAVEEGMNGSGEHHTAIAITADCGQMPQRSVSAAGYIKEAVEQADAGVGNPGLVVGAEQQAPGRPGGGEICINFGMELKAKRAMTGAEGLLGIKIGRGEQNRAGGQRKGVLVPMNHRHAPVAAGAENGIFAANRGEMDFALADLQDGAAG